MPRARFESRARKRGHIMITRARPLPSTISDLRPVARNRAPYLLMLWYSLQRTTLTPRCSHRLIQPNIPLPSRDPLAGDLLLSDFQHRQGIPCWVQCEVRGWLEPARILITAYSSMVALLGLPTISGNRNRIVRGIVTANPTCDPPGQSLRRFRRLIGFWLSGVLHGAINTFSASSWSISCASSSSLGGST